MSTDGGGWMLTWAYNHVGGENTALVEGTFPTSPETGYSHVNLGGPTISGFDQSSIEETRFYCTGAKTGRVMHFKTDNSFQVGAAFSGSTAGNSATYWNTGYTLMDGHNAYLPAATSSGRSGGFLDFPFYGSGYHWGIRGFGNRFECDDQNFYWGYDTQHLVYIRTACPAGTATSTVPGARR